MTGIAVVGVATTKFGKHLETPLRREDVRLGPHVVDDTGAIAVTGLSTHVAP